MVQLNSHGLWWSEVVTNKNNELTLAVLVTISLVIISIVWYKLTRSMSLPPGPRSLPIVGYLPFLGPDLHKQFTSMANTYGPIFKFYLGSQINVVINTTELVKEVVRDQDEIFANRNLTVATSVITYGGEDIVFSNNNTYWRNLRKIFVHEALSNKNLEASNSFRRDEVRKTIKNIFSKIGTTFNINEVAFLTEANVITSMISGTTSDIEGKQSNLGKELQKLGSNIVELFGKPNLSDIFPILSWFDFQGVERDMKKQLKKLEQIIERMIVDRTKSNSKKSRDDIRDHEGKKDFLQILLDLKNNEDKTPLSRNSLNGVLMDFLIAGTETTATLTEWAMAEIMKNDNVMKKIQEELAEVVGLNNIVEESHLPKLQYLDATIKETFRLHPVLPLLIQRSPSQDCVVGGYTIPKGCNIILNMWSIHRDPRYWENPLEFNPERFLTKKWDYVGTDLRFLPFGSGRRLCAGLPLAEKMQMFILASLLHSFDWNLPKGEVHDLSEIFGFTTKKKNPLIVVPYQRLSDASLYL